MYQFVAKPATIDYLVDASCINNVSNDLISGDASLIQKLNSGALKYSNEKSQKLNIKSNTNSIVEISNRLNTRFKKNK